MFAGMHRSGLKKPTPEFDPSDGGNVAAGEKENV